MIEKFYVILRSINELKHLKYMVFMPDRGRITLEKSIDKKRIFQARRKKILIFSTIFERKKIFFFDSFSVRETIKNFLSILSPRKRRFFSEPFSRSEKARFFFRTTFSVRESEDFLGKDFLGQRK